MENRSETPIRLTLDADPRRSPDDPADDGGFFVEWQLTDEFRSALPSKPATATSS